MPTPTQEEAYKEWVQSSSNVIHWLNRSSQDSLFGHIQDVKSSNEEWNKNNLITLFENTEAHKLQLKTEVHTIGKNKLSINDYALKI